MNLLAGFADPADHSLGHAIEALFFCALHLGEAKLRLALGALVEADGHLAAEIIFDEGGFVASALLIPGVDAEGGEIAGLAFRAARSGDEILRLGSGRSVDTIELKPGDGPEVGGGHAFADGLGQIELDETRDDPTGDGNGLIAGLRGGVGFGAALGSFAGRAGGQSANEEPVFPFCGLSFVVFALVADLHPIGDGARDDFDGNAAAKLIEARLGAAGLDAKIGLHLGAAAGLHEHDFSGGEELDAALPERGLEEQAGVDPADGAGGGADLGAVVAAGEDFDTIAVVQEVDGLANLRDAAPQRGAALADVGFADVFVLGAHVPGGGDDEAQERDGDEKLALHGRASGAADGMQIEGAIIFCATR